MIKKKDNLTDLIEDLSEKEREIQENTENKPLTVTNENGEIITLGEHFANKVCKIISSNKKKD